MRSKAVSFTSALLQVAIVIGGIISLVVILGVFEGIFTTLASGGVSQRAAAAASAAPVPASSKLISVQFEVHGKVQRVFFRKHTKANADQRQLTGWVKNTTHGTVIGVVEGPAASVTQMKQWLRTKGSPKSRIERCAFKNERRIAHQEFKSFEVRV